MTAHTPAALTSPSTPNWPPRRIQRRRTAGWTAPLDPHGRRPVYVGRGSKWGNPFRAYDSSPTERASAVGFFVNLLAVRDGHSTPDHVIPYPSDDEIRTELAGRDLMCWCPLPEPGQPDHCHGAVLLALAVATPGPDNGGAA